MTTDVSIIIPVYNTAHFLRRCINSILEQTFGDYEIILVNDGSTDNSPIICDEYAQRYNRIKVIHKENGGVSSARNIGIEASIGQYLMFCDADDWVENNWVETLLKLKLKNPKTDVFCNYLEIDPLQSKKLIDNAEDFSCYNKEGFLELVIKGKANNVVNRIFNASQVKKHKIVFPEGIAIGEDAIFNFQYFAVIENHLFINTCLYNYEYNNASATKKYDKNMFAKNYEHYFAKIDYIQKNTSKPDIIEKIYTQIFYEILLILDYTFDGRNNDSTIKKLLHNYRITQTSLFKKCLHLANLEKESKSFVFVLKTGLYPLYNVYKILC